MGFFDRLLGRDEPRERPSTQPPPSEDDLAVERYRYLLRTAPPDTIEQVHAEAFGKLTPEQRRQVQGDLAAGLPPEEGPRSDDPQSMARAATRGEAANPGFLERILGRGDRPGGPAGGPSFGQVVGGSILGTVAGYVIGSALVSTFMAPAMTADGGGESGDGDGAAGEGGSAADGADGSAANGADTSGAGDGGWGGDFGGGDLGGGGDFGGGDFGF